MLIRVLSFQTPTLPLRLISIYRKEPRVTASATTLSRFEVGGGAQTMEELRTAMEEHLDQMSDLVQKLSSELRSGFRPAYDNFMGFFHAVDWKEPWLMGLMGFYLVFLVVVVLSRKHVNFQFFLFLCALAGVFFAERLNRALGENWRSFAGQNYFDPNGLFLSVLWSGPLLVIAITILINTLFSMCYLIVKWKKAELRHRARLARKQD